MDMPLQDVTGRRLVPIDAVLDQSGACYLHEIGLVTRKGFIMLPIFICVLHHHVVRIVTTWASHRIPAPVLDVQEDILSCST